MNRKKMNPGGLEALISKGKDMLNNRMSTIHSGTILRMAYFKGKLGAAIAVITSLIVGFLIIPNNILYFIDHKHGTRTPGRLDTDPTASPSAKGRADYEYAYIHAGIALITLGCLSMVVSIVLSYFAAESKQKIDQKMDHSEGPYWGPEFTRSTRTVLLCLTMMNVELFMAVIAGCMEVLYRPLISGAQRLHNMECAIAVFNIIIYIMYVVTMWLTSTVLKGKCERIPVDDHIDNPDVVVMHSSARDYMSRNSNPYNLQSGIM